MSLSYNEGSGTEIIQGLEITDTICLPTHVDNCVNDFQYVAVTKAGKTTNRISGIVGLSPGTGKTSFASQLLEQDKITKKVFSLHLALTSASIMIFGGWDQN